MKKISLLVVVTFLLLTSCSSDNNNHNDMTGTLTVNGVSSSINKGYIILPYTGTDPNWNPRRFYLVLTDGNIAMQNNEMVYSDNIHQLVDFNLYTSIENPGSVENTTYGLWMYETNDTFSQDNPFIDHTTISTNVVMQNGHPASMDDMSSDDMDNGHCTISENNGIYTISFSFSNQGNTVTGNFTGPLSELVYQY